MLYVLQVQLPQYIENVREKLAENIHELWAMGKIELGWAYGEVCTLVYLSKTSGVMHVLVSCKNWLVTMYQWN